MTTLVAPALSPTARTVRVVGLRAFPSASTSGRKAIVAIVTLLALKARPETTKTLMFAFLVTSPALNAETKTDLLAPFVRLTSLTSSLEHPTVSRAVQEATMKRLSRTRVQLVKRLVAIVRVIQSSAPGVTRTASSPTSSIINVSGPVLMATLLLTASVKDV